MKIGVIIGFILVLSITACAGSNLDRSSALKQIQAYEKIHGIPAPMRKYFSLPTAIPLEQPPVLAKNEGSQWQTYWNAEMGTLQLYKNLVNKGFLKQEPTCNIHPNPDVTYYCFAPAGQYSTMDSFPQSLRGTTTDMFLHIAMAQISRETVTGIAKNASGTIAQADVEYDLSPTPAFKLVEYTDHFFTTHFPRAAQLQQAHWHLTWTQADVTSRVQKQYLFQKYDDGWRLAM